MNVHQNGDHLSALHALGSTSNHAHVLKLKVSSIFHGIITRASENTSCHSDVTIKEVK